jgi:hypothetical protein
MIIPLPTYTIEKPEPIQLPKTDNDYVRWFMNVPPWKCVCGLTNHGRNERCADWRCRLERSK